MRVPTSSTPSDKEFYGRKNRKLDFNAKIDLFITLASRLRERGDELLQPDTTMISLITLLSKSKTMPKPPYRKEVDSEEEAMEHQEAPKLVLNDSLWELDQLPSPFASDSGVGREDRFLQVLLIQGATSRETCDHKEPSGDEGKEAIMVITAKEALKAVKDNEQWLKDWRRQFPEGLNEAEEISIYFKEVMHNIGRLARSVLDQNCLEIAEVLSGLQVQDRD
uniref:Uncharacterized protein n=1 Tax=Cannabis sativa TaxID=3483 RepID=A0A803P439_CANSA